MIRPVQLDEVKNQSLPICLVRLMYVHRIQSDDKSMELYSSLLTMTNKGRESSCCAHGGSHFLVDVDTREEECSDGLRARGHKLEGIDICVAD